MQRQPCIQFVQIIASAACALLIADSNAHAQGVLIDPLPGTGPSSVTSAPSWSKEVTADQRSRAVALFEEAGKFVDEFLFEEAVGKYRQALAVWDHPAIHGNMSMALIALGRPLDAYRAVRAALRHGPEPLGDDAATRERNEQNLRRLKAIARAQIVQINVASEVPEVEVFIASKGLTTGSDGDSVLVLPRPHRMSAEKSGHQTMVNSLDASQAREIDVKVVSVHKMAQWKPWAVLAGGVGLSLAGGALVWSARSRLGSLEQTLLAECPPPDGCTDAASYDSDWRSTRIQDRIGATSLILGSGALLAGAALVWWNRERRFKVRTKVDRGVSLRPVVSPTAAGVSGTLSF